MSDKLVLHNVFFKLKKSTDQDIANLISDCHAYLKPVPGILYFSAGRILKEHARAVNVRDFHVGINITFISKAAHDAYQECDIHKQFVERNEDNWETVRVFDLYADYSG